MRGNFGGKINAKFVNTSEADAFNAVCSAAYAVWRHKGNVIYFDRRDNDADPINDLVTLHLKSATLRFAAAEVARQTGASIDVLSYDDRNTANLDLDNGTLAQALQMLRDSYRARTQGKGSNWTIDPH